ncbi:MAG: carbohydrate binding family 9 domain-containing protein [Tannerella sp.]|jgi:hypothetical protein|nr:carbohydrate binding family 9 domain-containing protein [Tannerella sp.]
MQYHYLLAFVLFPAFLFAQKDSAIPFEEAYKRVYTTAKVADARLLMDGRLNEDFWTKNGAWSQPFVQVMPYERVISSSPTRMKVLYDDKYIYIGVYCKNAFPERINRFIGNRDDNSLGDLISVAFDTYHDYRAAPEFNLNLGGNKTDLIVTDKLEINRSWNAIWEGRTHIDPADSSWTAEMRIPFSQLRYNRIAESGIWGLHVRRIIRHNNEVQNWSMIPLKNNGHVFSFGEMHGMTDLPEPRGIEILPYVMGKYKKEPPVKGSPYQKGAWRDGNIGLDAKFALSDFTLDLTVNPDYGQVELDPSVMNLTAYETFYEEKRPFFLEGKHILDFAYESDMMFYTRRIGASPSYRPQGIDQVNAFAGTVEHVPIVEALKLTGTNRRGLTLGVVQSLTARSSVDVVRNGIEAREVVEPLTNYSVTRLQKNWKGNTLLGGMVTSVNRLPDKPHLKELLVRDAFTAGIDFTQYFADRLYYIDMKGMLSSLHGSKEAIARIQQNAVHYYQRKSAAGYLGVDENRSSMNGTGGYVRAGRRGNARWTFSETFSWLSPGFDLNDAGYLKQADQLSNETAVQFRQTDTWKRFRSNDLTLSQSNRWDYGGNSYGNSFTLDWKSMWINRYQLNLKQTCGWNWIHSRRLRGGPDIRFGEWYHVIASFNTDKAKEVIFAFDYSGDYNLHGDYSFNTFSPGLTFRLGKCVYLSGQFNYVRNLDEMQYVSTVLQDAENPVYLVGDMDQQTCGLTMKLQVNVTPDISIQWYGSPFTSTAKFKAFKQAEDTRSAIRSARFYAFTSEEISWKDHRYEVQTGVDHFSFADPDFSFNEFRSNIVARWEYLPGSTLYFVWEHSMNNSDAFYRSGWGSNLDRMFRLPATNVLMVKLNYWFNF